MHKSSFYKRVTKYNPRFRNEHGHYLADEWTAIGDVGKVFAGHRLLLDEYLAVEARYAHAARLFLAGAAHVELESVELRWLSETDEPLRALYEQVERGVRAFPVAELGALVALALRECLWCRLLDDTRTRAVEFGYDYYMYLGFERADPECFRKIEQLPLFME
ncbi:hypothetical protein MUN81_22475 (plasmid) [Hymenobacter sp. 5317J-9]|uniref:hypothetical protein n=1 Tax=Hymenobacter sp. 5317J-9 TaxID=2932250 RepID=UPI001FD672C8|nr:hypothetical protein [Hymenobacter sp. 5317J-9]UOR00210.1 hypothetical protein MUN81_22475 [Hymenobacter sp. 5317J-9]